MQLTAVAPQQLATFPRSGRTIGSLFNLAQTTANLVREFQPDIIHAHTSFAGALTRLLYGWRPVRPILVYCPHGWAFNMQTHPLRQRFFAVMERHMARLSDAVVAISRHEEAEAVRIGIPSKLVTLIPNGITVNSPCPTPAGWDDPRRKILFIGRLDRQKGFDLLVQAVRPMGERIVVRAAGMPVTKGADVPQADNVELLGWLTPAQIEAQLCCADVVVIPSRWEGFGLTALEAMRAGKPVIASEVGGLPEIVEHGVTGRLFPSENIAALRAALLADDGATLASMGINGRQRFLEQFTIGQTHRALLALCAALVRETGSAQQGAAVEKRCQANNR